MCGWRAAHLFTRQAEKVRRKNDGNLIYICTRTFSIIANKTDSEQSSVKCFDKLKLKILLIYNYEIKLRQFVIFV